MPGPAPSLCPACGERPRRRAGLKCRRCTTLEQRARRDALKSGAPTKQRVTDETPRFARALASKRYLITSAQNATEVHTEFWACLQVAAKRLDAEIVVIPLRYKNPTSIWSDKQSTEEWWADETRPFLYNQRKKLNENLVLVGDVKIQPTATRPLAGFEALTGAESCIIGHPKMQFRSVASPMGRYPKILTTTGACTVQNYTDSKAGKLGDFHHFLGAVIVELDGKRFHLRQLNADRVTGEFTDVDTRTLTLTHYTRAGAVPAPRAAGLALADAHARFFCPEVERATFGPGGIVEAFDPEVLLWHDTLDGYSANPHHDANPFIEAAKIQSGFGDVRAEVEHAVRFVVEHSRGRRAIVVPSNHDNFLSRWVVSTDWRRDPVNAAFYLETAQAMLASVKMTGGGTTYADPFRHWVEKLRGDADVRALDTDERFEVAGIECGMHGDRGPNGAPGSLRNLARLGARVVSGHSHTPGIEEGHYQTGTSTPLRLEYNRGPSSWQNTHCVIYATGKRSLITIVDGRWRPTR